MLKLPFCSLCNVLETEIAISLSGYLAFSYTLAFFKSGCTFVGQQWACLLHSALPLRRFFVSTLGYVQGLFFSVVGGYSSFLYRLGLFSWVLLPLFVQAEDFNQVALRATIIFGPNNQEVPFHKKTCTQTGCTVRRRNNLVHVRRGFLS
jgi:hypothetical protein